MDAELFFAAYEKTRPDFRIPDSIASRFTLVSCLKYAPGAQVYLLAGADGASYILRITPAEAHDRLLREHLTLKRLHDPAFPHPVACFREGEYAYLLREYVSGTPLSELVENDDPMSPSRAVKLAREICAIMEKLHTLDPPIIHRDIKPHNFILTPEGKLCLVDLDAVSEYRADSLLDTVVLGTAATAAPEQFGYRRCDIHTDIYGVGMLLIFLMTGGYDLPVFLKKSPSRAPRRIVNKCVRFDPEMRYSSMTRLSRALARWQNRWKIRLLAATLALVFTLGAFGAYANRREILHIVAEYAVAISREDYVFSSSLVERAVRLQLDRPTGLITHEDLKSVERIYICGEEVYANDNQLSYHGAGATLNGEEYVGYGSLENLADLTYMPNLKEIGLSRLKLSDLSPLVGLKPDTLVLCGNKIENLDAISQMDSVTTLKVPDNPLNSLDGIGRMDSLRYIDISATRVTDLSPLIETEITSLVAMDMPEGVDISPLPSIPTLDFFFARDLSPAQCTFIADMPQLWFLILFYSDLADLTFLKDEVNLRNLGLAGNPCGSLEALSGLMDLYTLDVSDCGLQSLSGIENLPGLTELNISRNASADLSLLDSMPALTKLTLSHDMEDHLLHPADEYPFEIIWRD